MECRERERKQSGGQKDDKKGEKRWLIKAKAETDGAILDRKRRKGSKGAWREMTTVTGGGSRVLAVRHWLLLS